MSKVIKEFWVEYESFKQFKKVLKDGGKTELKISTTPDSGMDYMETLNISYEIDRKVTIKESDIDRLFPPVVGFTKSDLDIIKEKLFGGGENE